MLDLKPALPTLMLPNQRRLMGGRNLDGSFWIQIEGSGERVVMPPQQAMEMAVSILRSLGWQIEVQHPVAN